MLPHCLIQQAAPGVDRPIGRSPYPPGEPVAIDDRSEAIPRSRPHRQSPFGNLRWSPVIQTVRSDDRPDLPVASPTGQTMRMPAVTAREAVQRTPAFKD